MTARLHAGRVSRVDTGELSRVRRSGSHDANDMRIVYLAKTCIPSRYANTINVMKMCEAFATSGHKVILMNYDFSDVEPGIENVFDFYGVDPCFVLKRLPRKERYRSAYRSRIKWQVRLQRPDLVFARNNGLGYGLQDLRLPVILECHRLIDDPKDIDQFKALLDTRYLLRIVTISDALRRAYLASFGVPEDMIRVSPSGADLSDTRPPATLTESAKLNAGYIGSLYPGKGMEIIVELAKRCEWADFHIVGGLPEDIRHWESRASALTNVHFYGFVPHQEARRYQRAMDVLLLPNQRQVSTAGRGTLDIGQWTSPLKLFEYMAAAKPIVSTDLPVLREVLAHQATAYLCPPDDVEAWVDALKHLRDHPAERARLGQAAGSAFTANYSWKARALKILDGIERPEGLRPWRRASAGRMPG